METKTTPSEALYAFMGWLTTRKTPSTFSSTHDAAPAAELVDAFVKHQGWEAPRDRWDRDIKPFSSETPSVSGQQSADPQKGITVSEAMDVIRQALKEESGPGSYRHGWLCNLTEAFSTALESDKEMAGASPEERMRFRLNEGADNFLKRLETDGT